MDETLALAKQLIEKASVSPDDKGCQTLLTQLLEPLGFDCQPLRYGPVDNLWARRGQDEPLLVLAGHTDVVPPGPLDAWTSPPFTPTERNGYLYGRGTADMKSSLAAMIIACKRFVSAHPNHSGSIALLITSDEEADATHGTRKVVEHLQAENIAMRWCIVGEASSSSALGDTIKIGRRGSLNGTLQIKGKQGHIAYPHLADNPIHTSLTALSALTAEKWDDGNAHFDPTALQFSNVHAGTGATNVIPGELTATFNFRYSPEVTARELQERAHTILDTFPFDYTLAWQHSGPPFYTKDPELIEAIQKAVHTVTGLTPELSTSGGTSDGRFIAPTGCQVVEVGPCNATIHQVNECIQIADLERLACIYEKILENLLR